MHAMSGTQNQSVSQAADAHMNVEGIINDSAPNQKRNTATNRNSQRKRQRRRHEKPPPQKPACSVCSLSDTPPKYRCPRCNALYCSVACCKDHKTTCSQKAELRSATAVIPRRHLGQSPFRQIPPKESFSREGVHGEGNDDGDDESLDEGWRITEEMKLALSRSAWLRQALKDGGLKDLIAEIVSAGSRKDLKLQEVKERYPSFTSFLDKMLLVAGVLGRQDSFEEEQETFEELLERDWAEDQPTLALISRKERVLPVFEPIEHSSSSSDCASSEGSDSSSCSSNSSQDGADIESSSSDA